MGKHLHRLSDKDFDARTATCELDGPVSLIVYGNTYRCEVAYREHQKRMKNDRRGLKHDVKTDVCARCGFHAADKVQMDLDHINGDRTDHSPDNLQTLCANCHRLKSYRPALYALPA